MPNKKVIKGPTAVELVQAYMAATLENGLLKESVYAFCKDNGWEESDFYKHFGSMKSLQKHIWVAFFNQTQERISKDKNFKGYSGRDRLLSFFYTFFELLALNRSYVLIALDGRDRSLSQLGQLSGLRSEMRSFAKQLLEDQDAQEKAGMKKFRPEVFAESVWIQTLFLLRFWMRDDSASFEKTDMAIEKSVQTLFDIVDYTPLERVVDFGKFLFKEHKL